ncbi:MAG: arginine--tRNA ligase [Rhabdochlamydiaceae bacterium]
MATTLNILKSSFSSVLFELYGDSLESSILQAEVSQATSENFGHYQCNSAPKIGKELKKNPRDIALEIKNHFENTHPDIRSFISSLDIAGAGFINITLDSSFIAQEIEKILKNDRLAIALTSEPQKIIVEFSSPNVAKELHVGHIRSTIIGDCLARTFEFLGHDVLRLNHIGDWGTQFGMLIAYINLYMPEIMKHKETSISTLMTCYQKAKKKFDEDPNFKKQSQEEVVKLQKKEKESFLIWQFICDISRKAFQEIYEVLNVHIVERGESFYNDFLKSTVDDLEEKGLVTLSEGAKCIFIEGFIGRDGHSLPMIIQKGDGGFNYSTTDMAALKHRISIEKADRIIVVTDVGQSLHFDMIKKVALKAGYFDIKNTQMDHVTFGLVLGPDGKKFKTRSGETEKLIDLLDEAIKKAKEILAPRLSEESEESLNEMSSILGINCVKYADLSSVRTKDYTFSYEKMLRFEGNTAPFLLYAYVRINGIKKKIKKDLCEVIKTNKIELFHPTEVKLALHLIQFSEVLAQLAHDLMPHKLTDYLYQLAEKFHLFFHDCRVEGDKYEDSRLLLCEATSRTLKKGLELLGLKTLEKM